MRERREEGGRERERGGRVGSSGDRMTLLVLTSALLLIFASLSFFISTTPPGNLATDPVNRLAVVLNNASPSSSPSLLSVSESPELIRGCGLTKHTPLITYFNNSQLTINTH